jgi:hypothetical protein
MKKLTLVSAFLLAGLSTQARQQDVNIKVIKQDVYEGFITTRIWLDEYAIPQVSIKDAQYTTTGATVPDSLLQNKVSDIKIALGKERKRPFAVIAVPVYTRDAAGKQLTSVTLQVNETETTRPALRTTTATASPSPLASGTWHKIAVSETGLCKVDYNFMSANMGVSGPIPSAHIRLFGSGGNMLSENNAIERPEGLGENAIWVNDGGDGSFGPGDYFVFYARGPVHWQIDSSSKQFRHTKNLYRDKGHYFVNFDQGVDGKRIQDQPQIGAANATVSSFNGVALHEDELNNPGKLGKRWWGEDFSTLQGKTNNRNYTLNLGPVSEANFRIMLGSRCPMPSSFAVSLNGQPFGSYAMPTSNRDEDDVPVSERMDEKGGAYSSSTASFDITYTPGSSDGMGYLDYIEINTRRALGFSENSFTFRDWNSVAPGNIARFELTNAGGSAQVWDVTNPYIPVRMLGSLNGSTYSFTQDASTLHEYAAMNNDAIMTPEYVGKTDNQNLAGSEQVDYIIVTHPNFLSSANTLANFHRQQSGLRVIVATTDQVYNEFSSGAQDISAIRDMARMFYKRAGADTNQMPKYLLLLGDASYDYKDRVLNNTNYVPTFESAQSMVPLLSYCNDDFFGFLDDNEHIENTQIINALDLGMGRLPVKTSGEADAVVNKILHYKSPSSLGPWRLSTTFIADDEDNAGEHMTDAEVMDTVVTNSSSIYNSTKIYQNVVPTVSTPGGKRSPNMNKSLNDQVNALGTLLLNYSGHGNTEVLAEERILTNEDYNKWKNLDRLPFMVTATCDFGRFDHPDYVSAGEQLVLKHNGGVIAGLTTTHLVFAGDNRILNKDFLSAQFQHVGDKWNTFGDAFRLGKNKTYSVSLSGSGNVLGFRKFVLMGDPALEPNFPRHFIEITGMLDGTTGEAVDSIGALGEYVLQGHVVDVNNNELSNFNGRLSFTFFDKPRIVETVTRWAKKQFETQSRIIYSNATVQNGKFSVAFIVPKDINYDYGKGKISCYAENGETDGAGANFNYTVGGFSDNPRIEANPPIVRPYIGDSLFRNGGLTGTNTSLYVVLEDETGINVSGNSVGHDLVGILDDDVANPFILNNYYETAPNTYKRGYVNFPLTGIPDGRHRLTVRAWDANNNSGEGYVDFVVGNGNAVILQNLMNYPNPFNTLTHIRFEHNHPDETMKAELFIYNTSGGLVRTMTQSFTPTGSHSNEITWDGTGDNGNLLPAGVYIYRMKISTANQIETTAHQKLVIVRY